MALLIKHNEKDKANIKTALKGANRQTTTKNKNKINPD